MRHKGCFGGLAVAAWTTAVALAVIMTVFEVGEMDPWVVLASFVASVTTLYLAMDYVASRAGRKITEDVHRECERSVDGVVEQIADAFADDDKPLTLHR